MSHRISKYNEHDFVEVFCYGTVAFMRLGIRGLSG